MSIKIIIGQALVCCFLLSCNTHKISYECSNDLNQASIKDTITIKHPLLISLYKGERHNDVLISDSLLQNITQKSTLKDVLSMGGFLMVDEIEEYIPDFKSITPLKDFGVKKLKNIGNNTVKQFTSPFKKFVILSVNVGCYNNKQRSVNWLPITGKRNEIIQLSYPIKE